ncbi:MAG: hypothetical protein WA667_04635 [Candidatus Nitrosopolaris sp.]
MNGKTNTGHKAKYGSNFKRIRYAIILLASLVLPVDNTKEIQNTTFINYYSLDKVARMLGLEFDRTKGADKIFPELESKGKIRRAITNDSKTFITLTEEGKNECKEKLDLLQILNKEFYSDPSLQMKYLYEDVEGTLAKGFTRHTEKDLMVENLINRISRWND